MSIQAGFLRRFVPAAVNSGLCCPYNLVIVRSWRLSVCLSVYACLSVCLLVRVCLYVCQQSIGRSASPVVRVSLNMWCSWPKSCLRQTLVLRYHGHPIRLDDAVKLVCDADRRINGNLSFEARGGVAYENERGLREWAWPTGMGVACKKKEWP